MKKLLSYLAFFLFLMTFCSVLSFSQDIDLTGTWMGSTVVPDQGEDEMTLVVKKDDGKYAATLSDSFGMLMDAECEEFEFKEGTVTFSLTIAAEMESLTVWITLEVEEDTMKGYWETAEGDQGDIELKKQS